MRFTISLVLAIGFGSAFATAHAEQSDFDHSVFDHWQGPKAGDVRGPCPFMNTFSNHGFLPRSGKYITRQNMIDGLRDAVNFAEDISVFVFNIAADTNPEPNSTWFSLDHLARHDALEHDASLSRVDSYFGHGEVFDQATFDETRSHWGDIINPDNGVNAALARVETSNRTNPAFNLSETAEEFIIGETGAFIAVLGDTCTMTANKTIVEFLFQNERMPTELGWRRPESPLTQDRITGAIDTVRALFDERWVNRPSKQGQPTEAQRLRIRGVGHGGKSWA